MLKGRKSIRRAPPAAPKWKDSPAGLVAYATARADAQRRANELGLDHGIEANDVFKQWHVFLLPRRENRTGHELLCEVVSPEALDRCKPGHGPKEI